MTKFILLAALVAFFHFVPQALQLLEPWIRRLTGRRLWVSISLLAVLFVGLRIGMQSRWPVPVPFIHDEFAYLLASDLFSSGQTHLPADPNWKSFESLYILNHPTQAPKYPPLQGLFLAAGQILTSEPWLGVALSCLTMNLAIAWFVLPWVGRRWTLFTVLLVGGHLGLISYWMNSYWGGAATATAGALLLGAWTRLRRQPTVPFAIVFAGAWVALAAARPYEGAVILGLPLALHLLYLHRARALRPTLAFAATALLGALALAGYNASITGSPFKLPYLEYQRAYHYVPVFVFGQLSPKPAYEKPAVRVTMELEELRYQRLRSSEGLSVRWAEWRETLNHLLPWSFVLILLPFVAGLWQARRFWPLFGLLALGVIASSITVFHFSHYFAPTAPILLLLIAASLRRLGTYTAGPAVSAALVAVIGFVELQNLRNTIANPVPPHPITLRPIFEKQLSEGGHQSIIFVKDNMTKPFGEIAPEWIHNRANLDQAPVIWANDLGEEENQKLLRRWPDREPWRLVWPESMLTLTPLRPKPGQEPIRVNIGPLP